MNLVLSNEEKYLRNFREHTFDEWSKNLMKLPFVHDSWQKEQVGMENDGPYRMGYEALPIKDNGEPAVDLASYGVMSRDYYLINFLETKQFEVLDYCLKNGLMFPSARVRKTVAEKISAVDLELRKHDLFITVNRGWCHPELQMIIKDWRTRQFGEDYANKILANKSPHATAGCMDINLWSLQTKRTLSFSWKGDVINSFALEQKTELNELERAQLAIRRIMLHVMTATGFVSHPGEYFHFGYGDPLSAFLTKQEAAIYGPVLPEKVYQPRD